jgi:hypothetical protein
MKDKKEVKLVTNEASDLEEKYRKLSMILDEDGKV